MYGFCFQPCLQFCCVLLPPCRFPDLEPNHLLRLLTQLLDHNASLTSENSCPVGLSDTSVPTLLGTHALSLLQGNISQICALFQRMASVVSCFYLILSQGLSLLFLSWVQVKGQRQRRYPHGFTQTTQLRILVRALRYIWL